MMIRTIVLCGILFSATSFTPAEAAQARRSMEQCVDRVLSGLVKSRAPESSVGVTVVSRCDAPLRATLAEAIRAGQAGNCTVEACIALAQSRASDEAVAAYRALLRR
jgi:hypothetical protein